MLGLPFPAKEQQVDQAVLERWPCLFQGAGRINRVHLVDQRWEQKTETIPSCPRHQPQE